MTTSPRLLVVGALALFGLVLGTGSALAHDVLIGSDPASGAQLVAGPAKVTLNFDLPVQNVYSAMTVIGPDGLHYEAGPSVVSGNSVSAPVSPLGPAGAYTVGYRIVSDDGHPVGGSISFTLTTAGTGHGLPASDSPAAAQQSAASSGQDAGSESGGMPVWPWILGAVLLVAAGAVIALRLGRG
ncbi:MAG TPA: copper resistance CopC family protein [Pseudonocardia sp.]